MIDPHFEGRSGFATTVGGPTRGIPKMTRAAHRRSQRGRAACDASLPLRRRGRSLFIEGGGLMKSLARVRHHPPQHADECVRLAGLRISFSIWLKSGCSLHGERVAPAMIRAWCHCVRR
jgi:hypothetical protein